MARIELAALGYPELEIPEQLQAGLLPGILRDWHFRLRPASNPSTAEEVARIFPDANWTPLQLPMPADVLSLRSPDKWLCDIHRARAQGYGFVPNYDPKQNLEAVHFLESERERDVFINTGGAVYAVWLNGEKIYEDRKAFAWHPGRDRIPAHLRSGRNTIVVEAHNNFFVSVTRNRDWPIPGE